MKNDNANQWFSIRVAAVILGVAALVTAVADQAAVAVGLAHQVSRARCHKCVWQLIIRIV